MRERQFAGSRRISFFKTEQIMITGQAAYYLGMSYFYGFSFIMIGVFLPIPLGIFLGRNSIALISTLSGIFLLIGVSILFLGIITSSLFYYFPQEDTNSENNA